MKIQPAVTAEIAAPEDRVEVSNLAAQVQALKNRVGQVIEDRSSLPVPLFWSLFHSEVDKIKEQRQAKQLARRFYYGLDW